MAIDQKIFLAADNVVITKDRKLLLIRRGNQPFQGMWAFPGGFIETNEELHEAAARELQEETGLVLSANQLSLVDVAGRLGRDPRFRTVSVVYKAVLEETKPVAGSDDADAAAWFLLDNLPELAFDHLEILKKLSLV